MHMLHWKIWITGLTLCIGSLLFSKLIFLGFYLFSIYGGLSSTSTVFRSKISYYIKETYSSVHEFKPIDGCLSIIDLLSLFSEHLLWELATPRDWQIMLTTFFFPCPGSFWEHSSTLLSSRWMIFRKTTPWQSKSWKGMKVSGLVFEPPFIFLLLPIMLAYR